MKKVLGIGIDGITRDLFSQFDKVYRKTFIRNEALVKMDENFNYVPGDELTEEFLDKIEEVEKEKITLPVDTFDLLNHYSFTDKESLDQFFVDNAFEIYGSSSQFPRSFDVVNRLQKFGEVSGLFDVVLLSKEQDMQISATYHFLAKSGCKIKKIQFVDEYEDKWNYCDVLVDDCPIVFESKPKDKTSIKINHEYNTYSECDFSFDSVNEINENFLLKTFDLERYEAFLIKEKEREESNRIQKEKQNTEGGNDN